MVRPIKNRIVRFNPDVTYFKPRGIPSVHLEEVCLTVDGREAIRLSDLLDMSHEEAGRQMGVSRATFGRILQRARKSVAEALINGKAINIEGGNYNIVHENPELICRKCNHRWKETCEQGKPRKCSLCNNKDIQKI
jgi:predicted DNA-binding protein (UPF0251 family)